MVLSPPSTSRTNAQNPTRPDCQPSMSCACLPFDSLEARLALQLQRENIAVSLNASVKSQRTEEL